MFDLYDEFSDSVMTFPSVQAADIFVLTGQSTFTKIRPATRVDRQLGRDALNSV